MEQSNQIQIDEADAISIMLRASTIKDDHLLRRVAQIQRISDNNKIFAKNCQLIMKLEIQKAQKEKRIKALRQLESKSKLISQLYEGQVKRSQSMGFQQGRSFRHGKSLLGLPMEEQTKASRSD